MRKSIEWAGVLLCIVSGVYFCNATSSNITEFYELVQKGSNVSYDLCKLVAMESLENISTLIVKITTLKNPKHIVNIGKDRDHLITTEGKLAAEIACHMDVLQDISKVLQKSKNRQEKKKVSLLQEQLVKIFRDYSEYDFRYFKRSCNNVYSIINEN